MGGRVYRFEVGFLLCGSCYGSSGGSMMRALVWVFGELGVEAQVVMVWGLQVCLSYGSFGGFRVEV